MNELLDIREMACFWLLSAVSHAALQWSPTTLAYSLGIAGTSFPLIFSADQDRRSVNLEIDKEGLGYKPTGHGTARDRPL